LKNHLGAKIEKCVFYREIEKAIFRDKLKKWVEKGSEIDSDDAEE
jgi:hypothetical protein